jgi:hypothetical protein
MSDDLPPDESASEAAGDGRDDQVAALLEVPPLDDVTRRRLVTRAVAGSEQRHPRVRRVLFPAAAALVVLVLVGVGAFVLATRGGDGDGTAARTPSAAPGTRQGAPQAGEADASGADIPDLGDLGDLTDEGELRRRLSLARRDPPRMERADAPACFDRAVTGSPAPEAFATGTHRGRPVLVLVLPSGADTTTAVLLDEATCQAVSVVNLS